MNFSEATIRQLFPVFNRQPDLIYLDSAATSQKLKAVIDREAQFYELENANVYRGLYSLSSNATTLFESIRREVAKLTGAKKSSEITFTKGTTESINIVANSFRKVIKLDDNVIVTMMEHHANFIPWQLLCKEVNAELRVLPIDENGNISLKKLETLIDSRTRLVCFSHVSNVLGTINPLEEIIQICRARQVLLMVDAAQSVGHMPINVQNLDVDFLAFSAHKMFGPFGVGILYVKEEHHEKIKPLNFGGGIVKDVGLKNTTFVDFPRNVEAGTPNVAGVIAFGEAVKFAIQSDLNEHFQYAQTLAQKLRDGLKLLGGVQIVGNAEHSAPIVSFNVDGIHAHDVATFLADRNICVRAGHHCAQPLHRALNITGTLRASFSIYNSEKEVESALEALRDLKRFWK